jgi:hypothetical protein
MCELLLLFFVSVFLVYIAILQHLLLLWSGSFWSPSNNHIPSHGCSSVMCHFFHKKVSQWFTDVSIQIQYCFLLNNEQELNMILILELLVVILILLVLIYFFFHYSGLTTACSLLTILLLFCLSLLQAVSGSSAQCVSDMLQPQVTPVTTGLWHCEFR